MIETLNSLGITNGMITSAGITIVISLIAVIGGKRIETVPNSKLQGALELAVEKLYNFFVGIMGEKACKKYFPFVATLFIYILLCNYSGLLPMREAHGVRFFKHLFQPFAFLFPIMLIDQFVRPLSLTLRLYGNVFGEESVISSFFNMVPLGLPIPMQALSLLMGFVQAMVFSLLAAIYIGEAVETAEHLQ